MDQPVPEPLWRPSPDRIAGANATAFLARVREQWGADCADCADFSALWRWSVERARGLLGRRLGLLRRRRAERRGAACSTDRDRMPGARFFPEARLNFAENLLRRRDDGDRHRLPRRDRRRRSASPGAQLYDFGLAAGAGAARGGHRARRPRRGLHAQPAGDDRAPCWRPRPGRGLVSCSPDFGVARRARPLRPDRPAAAVRRRRLLLRRQALRFAGAGARDPARAADRRAHRRAALSSTATRPLDGLPTAATLARFRSRPSRRGAIAFERLPFDHPLYILYSSRHDGRAEMHRPRRRRHAAPAPEGAPAALRRPPRRPRASISPRCGWMMWNWLVSAPRLRGDAAALRRLALPSRRATCCSTMRERRALHLLRHLGQVHRRAAARPASRRPTRHDLAALRTIASTGSPLVPESFDYVYRRQSSATSACLDLRRHRHRLLLRAAATRSARSGAARSRRAASAWRSRCSTRTAGRSIGEKGELVCTAPFPSMPVGFWNDPDGAQYRAAYFERFPGVWCHGDYAEITAHGGMVIYGRSDAVLNPGGVRIGTAEIYRQVEQLTEVVEAHRHRPGLGGRRARRAVRAAARPALRARRGA